MTPAFGGDRGDCEDDNYEACNRAIQENPEDTASLLYRAIHLMENPKDFGQAMADLTKVISVPTPKQFIPDSAGKVYEVIAVGPCRKYDLATQEKVCNKKDEIIDSYSFDQVRYWAFYQRSLLHERQGHADLAMDDLNRLIAVNPGWSVPSSDKGDYALDRRAALYEAKGDKANALADYTKSLENNSNGKVAIDNLKRLGVRLMVNKQYGFGYEIYKEPEKIEINTPTAAQLAAFASNHKNCLATTDFDSCSRAIQDNPNDTEALLQRGLDYVKSNNLDPALADFTQSINVPKPIREYKGYKFVDDEVVGPCRLNNLKAQAIVCTPDQIVEGEKFEQVRVASLQQRAEIYKAKRDFDHAIADLNAVFTHHEIFRIGGPLGGDDWYHRALVYEAQGDKEKAIADMTQALKLDKWNEDYVVEIKKLGLRVVVGQVPGEGYQIYKEPVFK